MTVVTIIDQVLSDVLNIAASDGDNTATRARVLRGLTEVGTFVFNYRDWSFRRATATITVSAGAGLASLSSNFLRIGTYGGVWLASTGAQLEYVTEQELVAIRAIPGNSTDNPAVYSIFGLDSSYIPRIQIPTNVSAAILTVAYDTQLGTLDESSGSVNIQLIPPAWHQGVLMPGLRAMFRQQVGDGRYQDFREDAGFRMGLNEMVRQERHGDETTRSLPSFFGA